MAVWLRELIKYAVLLLPWALKFFEVWIKAKYASRKVAELEARVVNEADQTIDVTAQLAVRRDRDQSLRDRLQQHLEAERLRRPVRPGASVK
jgi:hypothetical protein